MSDVAAARSGVERDMTPAVGTPGGPARWRRAVDGARVALARRQWGDARWSYLFGSDTRYAPPGARRESGEMPPQAPVQGPVLQPPVWTWEVPLYFWTGGIAAGSSFVALACDLAGDERSARIARKVALAALIPSPPLLISDLGRPSRFYNMLRVFKPRSAMSMGAWALTSFGALGTAAVAADELGRPRLARPLGAATAVVGGYLGSYGGVLLSVTAVPLWAKARLLLGPIFVATATGTGASATRLVLVAMGLPPGHPTREALGRVETAAMVTELTLSWVNEKRLGPTTDPMEEGTPGRLFDIAKWSILGGLSLRLVRRRLGARAHHLASLLYLGGGLAFRYAWVEAGKESAKDHEVAAAIARGRTP